MKHLININLIVCLFLWPLSVVAQNISVSSFKLLDSDLTANTAGTMERDQNGEIAALIKVVTTEQGFVFDGGMTGIVKTKQEVGEVWVYVPHGIKKMTIKHPQLGVFRDYYFPVTIDKAKTYEMVLVTGKVETIVTRSANKQYVIFNVNPANAMVELDNMPLDVSSDGYAEKSMPYGTYSYRVSCANYHTEAGQVTVSAQGKSEVNVKLRPNFGWIEFSGTAEMHGAHIYVDNERIGQLPMKSGEMQIGIHQIKVLKPLYRPYEQQVTVTEGNVTQVEVKLIPNFAKVTFTTDAENEIWIDNKQCGKGQCTIGLEIGEYTVEVRRESYRTVSEVINVVGIDAQTFQLPSPIPVYGILDVSSAPSRAMVYIDGVEVGQTPLMKSDVLVGSRKITFKKEGYEMMEQIIDINENVDNKLSVTLEENAAGSKQFNMSLQGHNKVYTVNGVSFTMIAVKGGEFQMGATKEQQREAEHWEKPVHEVSLSDYFIGETEVTYALWNAVMGTNLSSRTKELQCPVAEVSWDECQSFILKLNNLTGGNFRLPTEAEWEYAARGGNVSKGYKYSGSDIIDDVAWYEFNSSNETHPVKTKQPNELGLYDMSGNVREWCSDRYLASYYSISPRINPQGHFTGTWRVVRGGSWELSAKHNRLSARSCILPSDGFFSGVRLVQPAKEVELSAETITQNKENGISKTIDIDEAPSRVLGAVFEPINDDIKRKLGVKYGLQVTILQKGKLAEAGVKKDFVVLKINGMKIASEDDLDRALKEALHSTEYALFISGYYMSGRRANYAVDLSDII